MTRRILNVWLLTHLITCAFAQQGVGIGTTSPSASLHVTGYSNGNFGMLYLTDSGTNSFPQVNFLNGHAQPHWNFSGALTGSSGTDFFNLNYGSTPPYTTYLSVNGSGQIGVGTTAQNNFLQVGLVPSIFSGNQLALGNGSQGMSFAQYTNSSTWYSNTSFSIMPNTGTGYVGIGTQSPAAPLHVYSTSTTATPNLLVEQADADFSRIAFRNISGTPFTLAAAPNQEPLNFADAFNIYSNRLGVNLVSVTTQYIVGSQPTGTINLNGIAALNQATLLPPDTVTLTDGTEYDDYIIPNSTLTVLADNNASASITITGFAGGSPGRVFIVYDQALAPIVLKNQHPFSMDGNRFSNPGGDITLHTGYMVTLVYVSNVWIVQSKNF